MTEIIKLSAAALIAVVVFSFVRAWNAGFDIPLKLTAAVFFLGALVVMAGPLVEALTQILGGSALSEYASVLLSAIGIAILTQTVSEICRECREGSIAGYVEMAGRLEILLLSLPLLKEVLGIVEELL